MTANTQSHQEMRVRPWVWFRSLPFILTFHSFSPSHSNCVREENESVNQRRDGRRNGYYCAAILAVNSIGRKERSEWVRSVRALPPPHRTLPPLPFQWVVFTSFTYPLFTVPSSLHSINKWTWRAFHSPTVHIINEWEGRETTNLDSPLVLVSSIIPWSWCLSSLLSSP